MNQLTSWKNKLSEILIRFQITIIFAILSCGSLIYLNHTLRHGVEMQGITFFLSLYPLSAMVLSLMLQLWTEEMFSRRKIGVIHLSFHALWLALCIYWATQYPLNICQSIACGVSIFAMLIGWITLPFIEQKNDMSAINFLMKGTKSVIIAALISLVLFLGLLLLMQSFHFLFGINIDNTYYADPAIFSFSLIAPILVLVQLPEKKKKYSEYNWLQHKFANGIVHWLLIPLHFAYMLTLYAYAFKILFTWQLPNGWVSWLVSILMLLTVVIIGLLYPAARVPASKKFDKLLVSYLPAAVLPLLVLMTIGIWRRFSDYGVTISRLYLLLFNVWCYAVCIGLIVFRSRKVMWIASSFAVVLMTVSIFPFNISSFTESQLKKEVHNMMTQYGMTQVPMNQNNYNKLLQATGYITAKQIDGKIAYLRNEFKMESTADIVHDEVSTYGTSLGIYFNKKGQTSNGLSTHDLNITGGERNSKILILIPQGYRYGVMVREYHVQNQIKEDNNQISFSITHLENNKGIENAFTIPLNPFMQMANTKKKNLLIVKNEKTQLFITYFSLTNIDKQSLLSLEGIMFIK